MFFIYLTFSLTVLKICPVRVEMVNWNKLVGKFLINTFTLAVSTRVFQLCLYNSVYLINKSDSSFSCNPITDQKSNFRKRADQYELTTTNSPQFRLPAASSLSVHCDQCTNFYFLTYTVHRETIVMVNKMYFTEISALVSFEHKIGV